MDYHATTPVDPRVIDSMLPYFNEKFGNAASRSHAFGWTAEEAVGAAREKIAAFIGAKNPKELVFTSGATESLNLVARGLTTAGIGEPAVKAGDEIIVSALEHHANLVPWQQAARRCGAQLRILHPDAEGQLRVDDLARLLNARTRVFAVTACANATGERPPYEALLACAAEAGALTVLDAAQAVSHEVPA